MSYAKQYLENARRNAHEQFASADGFIDNDLSFTANEQYFNADAGPSMGYSPAPTSQPYIITVSNASAANVANFDVLGAYIYLQNTGMNNTTGNLTISGVTISSGIGNVTYQQLLYQSMNSVFTVGLTYIQSLTVTAQVTQPLTVDTRDANGNQAKRPLIPTLDPYQQQNGIIAMKQPYRIDGYTVLTIANVLPSAVFQLYFYPSDNINIARGLSGNPASRQFGSPNIVRSSVAVVDANTAVQARLG